GNVASQATREAGLTALPPELLKCIAGHLPLDWQRLSLALALPHSLAPVIRDEVLSGCIADLIPKAKTLASFRAILSMIRCLSPGLQAGFLLEAGFAIHQVAKNMQPQVIEEWLAQIAVLSGTGKIPDELRALARIAGHLTPEDAVDARENVQTVARFHGFPTGARTLDLELRAVLGSAGKAVQGGENVQVIAK